MMPISESSSGAAQPNGNAAVNVLPRVQAESVTTHPHSFSGWERAVLLLFAYTTVFLGSHFAAFALRFDLGVPPQHRSAMWLGWLGSLPIKLTAMLILQQYSVLLGYFGMPDLWRVFWAMAGSSLVLVGLNQAAVFLPILSPLSLPRGVLLIDFVLSAAGITAIRLGFRVMRERLRGRENSTEPRARRVGIVGAGDVGATLAKELLSKRGLGLLPVVFFDDAPKKWRSHVHGVPVVGPPEVLRKDGANLRLDEVIMAMPSAPAKRLGEIIRVLQEAHLKFETVPSMDQLATGKVKVSQLRPVEIHDLLQREPVALETENIRHLIRERVVAVTGAGGSIGSELCRQIASYDPRHLLLIEQSEVQLFQIEQELLERGHGGVVVPIIANILDLPRIQSVFERFRPALVFHAAAHKHVPMMESQPGEALKNNSLGTAKLAELARQHGVGRFVLISTDKAINPTSVMGASKRLAEVYLQALSAKHPQATKFMAVRFGNVLGSSGSVIPVFTKQIARGGPVTVTHPEVTRYFMTIPEAVGLVLQTAVMGTGGEIFVLDMGRPVRIVDLARQLIQLSGLQPDTDIEIQFTGLRPGEKLFEELSHSEETHTPTSHPKIMKFKCEPRELEEVRAGFEALAADLHRLERNRIKQRMQELVPEYEPYLV